MRCLRGITTSIHRKEIVASQLFYFLRLTPFLVLMIEHNIGVSTVRTIELKRLDSDYFED
jgi:restriction system protein